MQPALSLSYGIFMGGKLEVQKMDYPVIIHGHYLLAAFFFLLVNLSKSSPLLQGKIIPYMTSDVNEVSGKSFDYIVVGGGTAGCPLAATLSERFSVLLVERGGSPYGNPLVWNKMYYGFALLQTDEFSSVAESFISKDGVQGHRGRVLGGSSAINGAFYSRASNDFVKRIGWDEELVKEAYEWVESKIVFRPELSIWQSVLEFGLLEAGFLPYNGFSWDHIEGTKIGGTTYDEFGVRHTSADLLGAGNLENITVLLYATVKNIIFHNNGSENERIAHGIRFIKSNGSTDQIYEAYLNQPKNSSSWGDVILSAGALGSPQILMLSGIGPQKHLKNFSIPLVWDLKGVGQEMKDNPAIALLADTNAEYRLPDTPQVVGIAKDFKFIVEGGILPISFNATRMPIAVKLAFPESKGKLKLYNTDPRQNPLVKFNYLAEEKDLDGCVEMAQLLQRVSRSESVALFLRSEPQNNLLSSPHELRDFCKKNVRTYYHYHGGCTVGSVVDNDYKVYGVKGLRVIDGSTFLESPGTNPMATLLMLGRYQGIRILRDRENTSIFNNQEQP
ncbi:protein HOTHEAD [Ricinus communis]|uniref:protein HOTHEAD n=1 Tax=Ricinus communis TaxID=3988 RepID=UPI00201AD8B3|nr:protein HOTHEAD [Ricinus communis]